MKPKMEFNTVSLAVIGVDIGKEVFHIVGLGVDGKIAFRRKIKSHPKGSDVGNPDHGKGSAECAAADTY